MAIPIHTDTWQLQEAKNRFSALVEQALAHGPQIVTRHGKAVVKVVPITEDEPAAGSVWEALRRIAPPPGESPWAVDEARQFSRVAERPVDFG